MAEVTSFWGHKGLQRRFGKVDGEPPKGLDDWGRWRRLMGMKQVLLVMVAAVVLVGCSNETPETSQATEAKAIAEAKAATEAKTAGEAKTAAEVKAVAWVSDPNDPNNVTIEAAIRKSLKDIGASPTGELTQADLEKVTELELDRKQLTSVKGLEKLTQLESLHLPHNKLTDMKGLENLTQLKELPLDDNQLTDVKGLEKLTQLEGLWLPRNQLTDLKGLKKLTRLTELDLIDNPDLTKAQIIELQRALPNCKIRSNPTK